jgi:hypothetical protein
VNDYNLVMAFGAAAAPTGTPTPTPVASNLRITPKVLNFGGVRIGKSRTKWVTIINLGRITSRKNALPILIEGVSGVTDHSA